MRDVFDQLGFDDIRERMRAALRQLWLVDRYLLEFRLGEWSVTHRLAVHLGPLFPMWNVDCEFNRNGVSPKLAALYKNGKRPDIIVHRRGACGPNLLVVEAKTLKRTSSNDRQKVKRCIEELGYRWGICLSLNLRHVILDWYSSEAGTDLQSERIAWDHLTSSKQG